MAWYTESYFNRRNWILENLQNINVSPAEAMMILMVDFLNEQNIAFTLKSLAEKCHCKEQEADQLISALAVKGYLKIEVKEGRIFFNIDGVFTEEKEEKDVRGIFELFEEEFGRLLNQNELRELNEWLIKFKEEDIIYALRQASIYNKKNFNYIRAILTDIEKGHKNEE